MSAPEGLPALLVRFVRAVVPPVRRDEVLGDLAASHRRRRARMGPGGARLLLWKEALGLLLWRARRTLDGTTTMGRDFLRDLRLGVRTLLRRPGFTLTAVVVLALGIGAPVTVFTLVDGIFLWRPAHVEAPHELVRLYRAWAPGEGGGSLAHPDVRYYAAETTTLEGLAAWGGRETVAWSADGSPGDQLEVGFVSDDYFDVLGVRPALGRDFLPEEDATPGTHPVMVLSHGFWRSALGGDPDAVGRTLTVAGTPYTVVGVAPEGFEGLSPVEPTPDAWLPIAMYGALTRAPDSAWWERLPNLRSRWLQAVGRRADGVPFERARAELTALGESLQYENKQEGEGVLVERGFLYRPSQRATLDTLTRVLLAAVAFVLAVAAANVAVLLLARAAARTREMGIRTALGAGRGRLARQLLTETLTLALLGGGVGVGLAWLLSELAGSLLPFAFAASFRPDAGVLLAALALTLLTALVVGLAPALHAARADVRGAISGTTRRRGAAGPARGALVVVQVALSMVLVAGALLFGRSFQAAQSQDVGFAAEDRLLVRVDLRSRGHTPEEGRVFVARALERLRALPGVESATTTRQVPFQGDWTTEFPAPPGATPNYPDQTVFTGINVVSGDYFRTMGLGILRGRPLDDGDREGAEPAAVVNETLARQLWPDQDPVGRTLPVSEERTFTVVGVAEDATYYELGEEPHPQMWASEQQAYQPVVHFLLHTRGPAPGMAEPVRETLRELDPALAFGWTGTLESVLDEQVARYRVSAVLVSLFGAVALLLAAAGLYGVIAFRVTRRTREIGVRMALGAPRGRVAGDVVGGGLRLVALGTALGLAGAFVLRRFTGALLYGVEPTDPVPLAGAAGCLLAVGVLAALAPARRATRVDPMEAMRAE